MAINNSNNITIAVGPSVVGERSYLLQTAGLVLYPFSLVPCNVEGRSNLDSLKAAMKGNRTLVIFPEIPNGSFGSEGALAEPESFVWDNKKRSRTGVLVRVLQRVEMPDGSVRIVVRGIKRVRYNNGYREMNGAVAVDYSPVTENDGGMSEQERTSRLRALIASFLELSSMLPGLNEEIVMAVNNAPTPGRAVDMIADALNFSFEEKIWFLSTPILLDRMEMLAILLNRELETTRLSARIQSEVHEAMGESQREFFLREQLRVIQKELNEDSRNPDLVIMEKRIEECIAPEEVLETIKKEFNRMQQIPTMAPEYHISYNYLNWMLDLPWLEETEDRLNTKVASRILEADHYGLEEVKKRILEFIAVLQLNREQGNEEMHKAPILCLVGPPGVGKTSLGQSIAKALQRNFIRVSLGGVHDEAEIRGHRRTYVGAMPGRIIQNIKRAGSRNPVFMLDEVDKLAHDMRGDPASALLEVLDPEQNFSFNDNFLEQGFDLSKVFFIATANVEEQIPGPLRDRMEIIRLSGYTQVEKREIAKRYLVKRESVDCGFAPKQIKFSTAALDAVIEGYTMEAGVRNLGQTIARVCRRLAGKAVNGELDMESSITVTPAMVRELLGAPRFLKDKADDKTEPGMATGMAWTGAGGVTLPVEVIAIAGGKGNVKVTGSIGKVMEESASIAFSLIRGRCEKWSIDPEFFNTHDFHIHVPDGATPKDGPSAGVTLSLALISCLRGVPLRKKLAMTGEITLTGRVTAVGGIREKVVAAMRAGITDVILPDENRKDHEELPEEVKNALTFHFVKRLEEAENIGFDGR